MNNFIYLKDIDFKNRRNYIGASDVPTLALLNVKYDQTPLTLWEEKTGRRDGFKGNQRTRAGKELEPLALKWGLQSLGEPIYENDFLISRYKKENNFFNYCSFTEAKCTHYPFIMAHADLIHKGSPFIMEGKAHGFFGGKRNDNINLGYDKDNMTANGIPSGIYLQVQTQMLCYDIPVCYVSVIIDTGIHRLYGPIPKHKKTQEKILALCERFWWNVEKDKPPKPETWKDILSLNPLFDKESKTVIAGDEETKVIEMKDRAKKIRLKRKELEDELGDIKNAIGLLIGENKYLESSTGNSLATAFNVEKYYLKDYKKMTKQRLNRMLKDGFITTTKYRDMRY